MMMNRELFGVFGDFETFNRYRSNEDFDEIITGATITVGVRDTDLGTPGWSTVYTEDDGFCVIWGEVYVPDGYSNAAHWLYDRWQSEGKDALQSLNGSHLFVIDDRTTDTAFVGTDAVRSRPCFYSDASNVRVFGSDGAAVGSTIPNPTVNRDGILEYLHLGVTLGEKTAITDLHRLPIDSLLTASSVESLDRFVYRTKEFDYVAELANRLERALDRRSSLPGTKGILLSAGYDSRIILSQISDIEFSYTVGSPVGQEVRSAKRLAHQYDAKHTAFPPDERYIRPDESKIRYTQGIKESLHIHHAGYTDLMNVDTMYHGLLCDTFFRGHFTADETVEILGKSIPTGRLDSDPNPIESLLSTFGFDREASIEVGERTSFDVDPETFVQNAIAKELKKFRDRTNTVQNTLACLGIANQPCTLFHDHLSDHFLTAFLAIDRELLEWHLRTPPEHRTTETLLQAFERLDADILRHRPPDRPHESTLLNGVEGFVRRKTPFLTSFQPAWPDRRSLFDRYELDQQFLPELEHLHELPARHKLRIIDLREWIANELDVENQTVPELLPPKSVVV